MRISQNHIRIVTAATAVLSVTILLSCNSARYSPDKRTVSAAEDEVYEAVINHLVSPNEGRNGLRQLVFDDSVLTDLCLRTDTETCKERVRKELLLEDDSPPFNSVADKLYRVFTHHGNDGLLQDDTIKDFLGKTSSSDHLSRTFHTDLPRVFITPDSDFFDSLPRRQRNGKEFRETYPGAGGIFSLSHVGFDSNLSEAIVSTSFVCGYHCRMMDDFVLSKKTGKWEVVTEWVPIESRSTYLDFD
jgi:hypothetical protein